MLSMRALLAGFLIIAAQQGWCGEIRTTLQNVQAEDGDTLVADLDGKSERIQISGIDAPENADNPKLQKDLERTALDRARLIALGEKSRQYLAELVQNGAPLTFIYDPEKPDRYGRPQGAVRDKSDVSLAHAMVMNGYAMAAQSENSEVGEELQMLQDLAIESGLGIWAADPETAKLWAGR